MHSVASLKMVVKEVRPDYRNKSNAKAYIYYLSYNQRVWVWKKNKQNGVK